MCLLVLRTCMIYIYAHCHRMNLIQMHQHRFSNPFEMEMALTEQKVLFEYKSQATLLASSSRRHQGLCEGISKVCLNLSYLLSFLIII